MMQKRLKRQNQVCPENCIGEKRNERDLSKYISVLLYVETFAHLIGEAIACAFVEKNNVPEIQK